jgi:hypothetical protein
MLEYPLSDSWCLKKELYLPPLRLLNNARLTMLYNIKWRIQYSLLGRTAASIRLNTTFRGLAPSPSSGKTEKLFCLRMGTELVPETLYSNELMRLCAREDYIESCRRESFKTYIKWRTQQDGLRKATNNLNQSPPPVDLCIHSRPHKCKVSCLRWHHPYSHRPYKSPPDFLCSGW